MAQREAGEPITPDYDARIRAMVTWVTDTCVDVARFAHHHGGGAAAFSSSPLQQVLRDILVASQHIYVADVAYERTGAFRLGQRGQRRLLARRFHRGDLLGPGEHVLCLLEDRFVDHLAVQRDGAEILLDAVLVGVDDAPGPVDVVGRRAEDPIGWAELIGMDAELALEADLFHPAQFVLVAFGVADVGPGRVERGDAGRMRRVDRRPTSEF